MQSDCLLQRTSHSTYLYILLFVYSLHTRTFYWILFKTCTPVYLHPHRNNFFSSYFSHFWMDRNTEKLQWINIFLFLLFTLQFFVFFFLVLILNFVLPYSSTSTKSHQKIASNIAQLNLFSFLCFTEFSVSE